MGLNISHLLIHTIYVKAPSGVSNSGMPTYGSKTSLSARVERKSDLIIGFNGNEQQYGHVVVTTTEIKQNSIVWFEGDDNTKDVDGRRPIAAVQADTTDGDTLYETYF